VEMFIKLQEYIEDPQELVCVLIGVVGGRAHAQQSALTDTVPSDSVRGVYFLLGQMDQIRRYSNCHVQCSFIAAILHALGKESAMYIKQTESELLSVVVSWQNSLDG